LIQKNKNLKMSKALLITLAIFLIFILPCFLSLSLQIQTEPSTLGIGYFLNKTITTDAYCLDGSGPLYYHVPGIDSGSTKWYIHFEGGGWCSSLEDCFNRAQTNLGSTLQDPPYQYFSDGYFSNIVSDNSLLFNWNKIYIRYCDGGSFSGDNVSYYGNNTVYFKGKKILDAVFQDLFENRGLDVASDVVVSGGSAGGLASILHGDYVKELVGEDKKVVMLPDGGFFLDFVGTNVDYHSQMRWVFETMNCRGGVNQKCVDFYGNDDWKCFFAEYSLPFVVTPVFLLQSKLDSWQIINILGDTNTSSVNKYGNEVIIRLGESVLSFEKNSGFVDSCYHHCGFWNQIHINNVTQSQAFYLWYNGIEKKAYVQDKDYMCTECCT